MQQICIHCGLSSDDGNLWCQRVECSAANMMEIIRPGELFGEYEIGQLIHVTRTATFYHAKQQEKPVIIKIANADISVDADHRDTYGEYLKRETKLLQKLLINGDSHVGLPVMLPPYSDMPAEALTNPSNAPYGRTTYLGRKHYYSVFEPLEGEFMRDLLNRHPQLPPRRAGWITYQICEVVAWLDNVVGGYVHGALSPDVVFLRPDADGIDRVVLFDLGLYNLQKISARQTDIQSYRHQLSRFVHPAYTARELLYDYGMDARTDVYGLSLIMYEALIGHPVYKFNTLTEEMVRNAIDANDHSEFYREDMDPAMTSLINNGLGEQGGRLPQVVDFGKQLAKLFGYPPEESDPRPWWRKPRNRNTLLLIALFSIVALIGLAVASSVL